MYINVKEILYWNHNYNNNKPKRKQKASLGINNVNSVYTGELVRATASPDDESERSTIPPAWEAGASAVASLKQWLV